MCFAQRLTERNIWVKFNEIRLQGSGDVKRTPNSRVNPLTCDMDGVQVAAHRLTERSLIKIVQRVQEIWSRLKMNGMAENNIPLPVFHEKKGI